METSRRQFLAMTAAAVVVPQAVDSYDFTTGYTIVDTAGVSRETTEALMKAHLAEMWTRPSYVRHAGMSFGGVDIFYDPTLTG